MSAADVAIAVASRARPLRLRWLLNALAEQSFPTDRLEVIVAYDPSCAETDRLVHTHPLSRAGRLRPVPFPPGPMFPGAGRNVAWRATGAPLILFTDDDCRPDREWVSQAVAAASRQPGAIVQGRTLPDPDESAALIGAPWVRTVDVAPPSPWGQTCNIAYPRNLLERVGGFDERMRVGEDSDLMLRSRVVGAEIAAAPQMLVFHAVEALWLPAMLRAQTRWRDLALLAKRHPRVRSSLFAGIWWKREHAAFAAALTGVVLAPRRGPAVALSLPWLALSLRHRGYGPRGLARSLGELPGRAAIDATEIATMVAGSLRYRTLLL